MKKEIKITRGIDAGWWGGRNTQSVTYFENGIECQPEGWMVDILNQELSSELPVYLDGIIQWDWRMVPSLIIPYIYAGEQAVNLLAGIAGKIAHSV